MERRCVQVDKTRREQRVRYLWAVLATLVALGLFFTLLARPDVPVGSSVRYMLGWQYEGTPTDLPIDEPKELGDTYTISAPLPILAIGDRLIFRSENLNIRVALDGNTIYQTVPSRSHETIGDEWHMVYIPPAEGGQIISISGTILYPNGSNHITAVYLGQRGDFIKQVAGVKLSGYIISALILLIGLSYLLGGQLLMRPLGLSIPIALPGLCISMGLWCAMQTQVPELLFGHTPLQVFVIYATLPFAMAMAALYLRTLPAPRWVRTAQLVIAIVELLLFALAIVLEELRIAAFVETLPLTRLCMAVLLLLFMCQLPTLVKQYQDYFYLLLGLACLGITVALDLVSTYRGTYDYARNTRFGLFWMVLLITVQYGLRLRESLRLADQAEVMRSLAYRDALTGLANRLALVGDQELMLARKDGCVGIVQMDINNLKPVNDVYGHEAGDALILRASRAIQAAFGDRGTCYRVGGDEFVALITRDACDETYETCAERLADACDAENVGQEHLVSIALGFALYQPALGDRFYDLVRIADKRMYDSKREMKGFGPRDLLKGDEQVTAAQATADEAPANSGPYPDLKASPGPDGAAPSQPVVQAAESGLTEPKAGVACSCKRPPQGGAGTGASPSCGRD